jgi:hypothetical protein
MPKAHTVEQGEHISSIAEKYGFGDYRKIWDHAGNAELRKNRANPNVLFPGDVVQIPDRVIKAETGATGQVHIFELLDEPLKLCLVIEDLYRNPISEAECRLMVAGKSYKLTTDDRGQIEQKIERDAHKATLTVKHPLFSDRETQFPLKIGHLDPADEVSGQIARLNNLGYDAGAVPEKPFVAEEAEEVQKSPQFRSAVEEFQCDFMGQNNLAVIKQVVDGICGPKTQKALLEAHGC